MKKLKGMLVAAIGVVLVITSLFIGDSNHNKAKASTKTTYTVTTSTLNVRTGPAKKYKRLGTVSKGTKLSIINKQSNGWYKIKYKKRSGFISGKYVKVNKNNFTSSKTISGTNFVNVKKLDNSIIVDLRYNTMNNFTGERIYNFNQAVLRESTTKKLVKANLLLKKQGFKLKILDAYRPYSAQEELWIKYPDPSYVAKPNKNNIKGHMLGATVDITLITLNNKEVNMQSKFDDFSSRAHRDYKRTSAQEKYYQILNKAMTQAGFTGYSKEWWHYSDSNQNFKPLQVDPGKY